jgi:hypothetical protein
MKPVVDEGNGTIGASLMMDYTANKSKENTVIK